MIMVIMAGVAAATMTVITAADLALVRAQAHIATAAMAPEQVREMARAAAQVRAPAQAPPAPVAIPPLSFALQQCLSQL